MAIEEGVVLKSDGSMVLIETAVSDECAKCAVGCKCMKSDDSSLRSIWAESDIKLVPGDRVAFIVKERVNIIYSLLVYLLPVVFLISGAILGVRFSSYLGIKDSDLAAAVIGFVFFSAAWIPVRFISIPLSKKKSFKPEVIEKL